MKMPCELLTLALIGCAWPLAAPEAAEQDLPLAVPADRIELAPPPAAPVPDPEPIAPVTAPSPVTFAPSVAPRPPRAPTSPPPPPQVLPDLAVTQLAYDTGSSTVIVKLANLGGASSTAELVVRVELRRDGSARPDLVLERSLGAYAPEGYTGQLRASVLDFDGSPDLILELGGPVTVQATIDPRGAVAERDETNNGRSARLMLPGTRISPPPPPPPRFLPPPPQEPIYVPVPVEQAPPPAAQVQVALRSLEGAWANVFVDGRLVWEPKSFDKEKVLDVRPGVYTIEVKDFMNTTTWAKGRLHVDGSTHLALGIADGRIEVYGPDGVWQPL